MPFNEEGASEWPPLLTSVLFHNLFSFVILTCVVSNVAQVSEWLLAVTGPNIHSCYSVVSVIMFIVILLLIINVLQFAPIKYL